MGKIKNISDLSVSDLRSHAVEICEAGFWAVDTGTLIKSAVSLSSSGVSIKGEDLVLDGEGKFYVVAFGKCALDSCLALEDILGDRIESGICLDVRKGDLRKIKSFQGTHPMPSQENVLATRKMLELLSKVGPRDVVLFIVSGGGSTLLCQPKNMTFEKEIEILKVLFEVGATIHEINILRKHLSFARGGQLSYLAREAKRVSLIFSDVPGDDISFISSAPTVMDDTTIEDAKRILDKYEIWQRAGISEENLIETPKEGEAFGSQKNILLATNKVALEAMSKKAGELGYVSEVRGTELQGEAKEVGLRLGGEINAASSKTAIFYGGETTVNLSREKRGEGGRNQEVALSALRVIEEGELVCSVASDGQDHSEFAGALCDTILGEEASRLGLLPDEYLKTNSTFEFFKKAGGYISTGYTGSNVSDLMFALKK